MATGRGRSVAGRVVDAAGKPVRGAKVIWFPPKHRGKERAPAADAHSVGSTNKHGGFRIEGLPTGPCLLGADYQYKLQHNRSAGLDGFPLAAAVPLEFDPTAPQEGVELRLPFEAPAMGELEVLLLGPDGKPVHEASYSFDDPIEDPPGHWCSTTNEDGRATLHAVAGRRRLHVCRTARTARFDGEVEVPPWDSAKTTLRLGPPTDPPQAPGAAATRSVLVHVEDDAGKPIEGAEVKVWSADVGKAPEGCTQCFVDGESGNPWRTGADGKVRVPVPSKERDPRLFVWMTGHRMANFWSHLDRERRVRRLTYVLWRETPVRLAPVDAESRQPIDEWRYECTARVYFEPGLRLLWRMRGARSSVSYGVGTGADTGTGTATGSGSGSGVFVALNIPPGPASFTVTSVRHESATVHVEVPRQVEPFEVAIPMRRRK